MRAYICHLNVESLFQANSYPFFSLLQRVKVISDLLISVSKAERQEARMKVRQDSLRLGNVGVVRYCLSIRRIIRLDVAVSAYILLDLF